MSINNTKSHNLKKTSKNKTFAYIYKFKNNEDFLSDFYDNLDLTVLASDRDIQEEAERRNQVFFNDLKTIEFVEITAIGINKKGEPVYETLTIESIDVSNFKGFK